MAKAQTFQLTFDLSVIAPEEHEEQKAAAIKLAGIKRRRCLSCDQDFNSDGPGNRICPTCKERDLWSAPVEFFSVQAAF